MHQRQKFFLFTSPVSHYKIFEFCSYNYTENCTYFCLDLFLSSPSVNCIQVYYSLYKFRSFSTYGTQVLVRQNLYLIQFRKKINTLHISPDKTKILSFTTMEQPTRKFTQQLMMSKDKMKSKILENLGITNSSSTVQQYVTAIQVLFPRFF